MSTVLNELVREGIATEVYEVVRVYRIHLKGNPQLLQVKILRDDDGRFVPSLSHDIQEPKAAGPYSPSWHPGKTIEDAQEQVRSHISTSYKPGRGDKLVPNESF